MLAAPLLMPTAMRLLGKLASSVWFILTGTKSGTPGSAASASELQHTKPSKVSILVLFIVEVGSPSITPARGDPLQVLQPLPRTPFTEPKHEGIASLPVLRS